MARKAARVLAVLIALECAAAARAGGSSDRELSQEDRIQELERTVEALAAELQRTREQMVVPAEPELKGEYGMGPAASKVYQVTRGLSLGGYAEGFYTNVVADKGTEQDRSDFLRAVLYTGYKFTDRILYNQEIEFEHGTTSSTESSSGGSVSVEFAQLDFLLKEWANARAGLLLAPMGFLNKVHEPPFYYGVYRPEVERRIIPTTWRENGAGLFGAFGDWLRYETYVMGGFNAVGFRPDGLRNGRQNGNRALAEDLAFVGSVSLLPTESTLLASSFYYGKSGQNQTITSGGNTVSIPGVPTALWELHAQYRDYGLQLRALFTLAYLDQVGALSRALQPVPAGGIGEIPLGAAVGGEMLGGYAEIAYDVLPLFFPDTELALEPFYRFEYLDTQREVPGGFATDQTQEQVVQTVGFSFKPIPNVVIKADYRNRDSQGGNLPDEVNLGIGLAY